MPVLICGSLAFDTIMVFPDQFKNHILPDKVHMLNVSFLVPGLRREFGGCAGNIAYNLNLLGGEPLPMAAVGKDFDSYRQHLQAHDICLDHVLQLDDAYTAQAFITTDLDDNQITAFHAGAMMRAHENQVRDVADVSLGIVAPDGAQAMQQHAHQFAERDIPFIFDPGQAMPLFDGAQFRKFIDMARYVTVNAYEAEMLQKHTGWSAQQIADRVGAYIVTRGAQGSSIHTDGKTITIPAAACRQVVDPTGCGDAYRAGLIHGLSHAMDWETTGRVAALMGALKIEHAGTQNQHFSANEFAAQFKTQFGYALD